MDTILVVVRPFGPHRTGDSITDADAIKAVLASDHAGNVVATQPVASDHGPEEH